ncbi:hypothetical protein CK203_051689 [Vitis vinifera]|uniref:Uncharacterized protein n=1 Tax=Vitis vinifera TaxID=29760 RepID=A0A438H4Y3_VITVI|nr:hypothetical protein CK203_051689 [Vitis vinifera]
MEVARSKEDILVTQRKCTLDLLKETDMIGCKPAETLMDPRHRLGAKLEDCKSIHALTLRMSHRSSTMDIEILEGYPRKRPNLQEAW